MRDFGLPFAVVSVLGYGLAVAAFIADWGVPMIYLGLFVATVAGTIGWARRDERRHPDFYRAGKRSRRT